MTILETLTPAELARQLGNPNGSVGLAVADWLNENNSQANARIVAGLNIESGCRVLEIGFGNGRMASVVVTQALDAQYAGVDISPTMVAEASAYNADLVDAGRASFQLAHAHEMPFAADSFDRVFSMGVIHFWTDPLASLTEVRRVLRPAGLMLMACLAPKDAPAFAHAEYGFHLREASEWDDLCREAGFSDINVQTIESEQITLSGTPVKRHAIMVRARA